MIIFSAKEFKELTSRQTEREVKELADPLLVQLDKALRLGKKVCSLEVKNFGVPLKSLECRLNAELRTYGWVVDNLEYESDNLSGEDLVILHVKEL